MVKNSSDNSIALYDLDIPEEASLESVLLNKTKPTKTPPGLSENGQELFCNSICRMSFISVVDEQPRKPCRSLYGKDF